MNKEELELLIKENRELRTIAKIQAVLIKDIYEFIKKYNKEHGNN